MTFRSIEVLKLDEMQCDKLIASDIESDVEKIYQLMGLPKKPQIHISGSYFDNREAVQESGVSTTDLNNTRRLYNARIKNKGIEARLDDSIEELYSKYQIQDDDKVEAIRNILEPDKNPVEQGFGACFENFYSIDSRLNEMIYDFYKKGIFNIVYSKNHVFVMMSPKKIRMDGNGRLHSVEKPAIEFHTANLFYIYGVRFDKALWTQVSKRKLTVTQVVRIPNIEQRAVALRLYGAQEIIDQLNGKLLDKSSRGNELYVVKIPFGRDFRKNVVEIDAHILKYKDKSTNRVYASFVPPEQEKADEAMAWKVQMTPEEYSQLEIEA